MNPTDTLTLSQMSSSSFKHVFLTDELKKHGLVYAKNYLNP